MATNLELFGEFEDQENKFHKKLKKKYIFSILDPNKFENFVEKNDCFLFNIMNFAFSIIHFIIFLVVFYIKKEIIILIVQGLGTFLFAISSIFVLKIRKNKSYRKIKIILTYLMSILNYSIILFYFIFFFQKILLLEDSEENITNQILINENHQYLLIVLVTKFLFSYLIFRRVKILLIVFCILELIILFVYNYISFNKFIIEMIINLISFIVNFFLIQINENLYLYYFFFRKSFKKVCIDFSNKLKDLGIKNFIFNGEKVFDVNKTLEKKKDAKTNRKLKLKKSNPNFHYSKSINKQNNFIENLGFNNQKVNYPTRKSINFEGKEYFDENNNILRNLPNINIFHETFSKKDFLNKLIFYGNSEIYEDSKTEMMMEQMIIEEMNFHNRFNEYEPAKLRAIRCNTIQNPTNFNNNFTLLEILEALKLEFEQEINLNGEINLELNNKQYIREIKNLFEKNSYLKNVNLSYSIFNNNINNNFSNFDIDKLNFNCDKNDNNINVNNKLNYNFNNANFNNSSQNGLLNKYLSNNASFGDYMKNINGYNYNKNILKAKTFNNIEKTNTLRNYNYSKKLFNRSKTINFNNEENINSADLENSLSRKVKALKSLSETHENYIYVGKFISKDSLRNEGFIHGKGLQISDNLHIRTLYKVYYKKIIKRNKIFIDILICEDTDFIKESKINKETMAIKKQELEDVIDAKEFGKLAHEIKTPLNAIIGLINDLMYKNINIEILPSLTSINGLTNYLIFLVSDLTQYCNNISYSEIQIFIDKINLNDILNFCYNILNALLMCKNSEKSTEAVLNFEETINFLMIKSDEVRLKQILLNFISNAVKFTKSGKIEINAKIKIDMNVVKISVIDTGIGIKEDDLNKLFNDQQMLRDNSVINRFGSGFGLSISKTLSEKLNIKLKAKSTYQVGSKFSILIPFEKINYDGFENIKPSINILKSNTDLENSYSLSNSTRKNSNNILICPSLLNIDKQESSLNLNAVNQVTERSIEKTPTKKFSYKKPFTTISYLINNFKEDFPCKYIIQQPSISKVSLDKERKNLYKIIKNLFLILNLKINYIAYSGKLTDSSKAMSLLASSKNLRGNILIVDDNQIIRKSIKCLLKEIFKTKGKYYNIIEGSDGVDTLKLVIDDQKFQNSIKCVFSDEKMEYFDGSRSISILRELENSNKIKKVNFVSITSYDDNIYKNFIKTCGADYVIQKPCSKSNIINVLENFGLI